MFRDSQFALWHANYMGRENLKDGIAFPDSGSYLYNYHADDIDWQIECDFLGMMYPGLPNEAAERAFELGHIMNYGDGVYGGVFVTAMHAAAFTATSIEEIIDAGVSVIPEGTEFRMPIDDVMASYKAGDSFEKNWRMLEDKWAPHDLCPELPGKSNIDAKLNSGYILLGLLYGEGDFAKTIILSTRCGQDSDCNPSSAASILGNFYGASGIPEQYKSALDRKNTKFATTRYNYTQTLELNISLMKQVLEKEGVTAGADGYTFHVSNQYEKVPFEQWADGVFVYLKLKTEGGKVIFNELTPYSKNEKVVGYEIDFGDGKKFNDVTPACYYYEKAGTYTVKVTVTGDKGSTFTAEREITVKQSSAADLAKPIIVCSVLSPYGGGSRDINIIADGKMPTNDQSQYDTYILGDPHGNPPRDAYIGYLYKEKKTVSEIVFTEGNHFGNGGWFANGTLKLELFIDGKWQEAELSAETGYPNGNAMGNFGKPFESYTFTLKTPTECTGIRLYGTAGGGAGFISVGELEVK